MIGLVLSFIRGTFGRAKVTDVKCNLGGGEVVQAQHFSDCGDDSPPLASDYALLVETPRSGTVGTAGYVDPVNEAVAAGGEKRIYGRDSEGKIVNSIWLKGDGTIVEQNQKVTKTMSPDGSYLVSNGAGSFGLLANGNFVVNGVTIDITSLIVTPSDVQAGTVSLKDHLTSGVTPGVGNSGPPVV